MKITWPEPRSIITGVLRGLNNCSFLCSDFFSFFLFLRQTRHLKRLLLFSSLLCSLREEMCKYYSDSFYLHNRIEWPSCSHIATAIAMAVIAV